MKPKYSGEIVKVCDDSKISLRATRRRIAMTLMCECGQPTCAHSGACDLTPLQAIKLAEKLYFMALDQKMARKQEAQRMLAGVGGRG